MGSFGSHSPTVVQPKHIPMIDIIVSPGLLAEGSRLDRVLMQTQVVREAGVARSYIAQLIRRGAVQINGIGVTKAGAVVGVGDVIAIAATLREERELVPYDLPLSVVYEDDVLLVIDKPAGLTVHPGAGNQHETLLNAIVSYRQGQGARDDMDEEARELVVGEEEVEGYRDDGDGDDESHLLHRNLERGGIVHRLDKDTSGLLVVAKTPAAHANLAQQFADRTVGRRYRAVVLSTPRSKNPHFAADEGVIDAPIGRHPTQRVKMAVLPDGRRAVTHVRVVERFHWAMLLEARLETGRTHQIRVHCAHRGAPVIGDPVYGSDHILPRPLELAAQRLGRQALHAATLEFTHPTSGERLAFASPLPADMEALIGAFRE